MTTQQWHVKGLILLAGTRLLWRWGRATVVKSREELVSTRRRVCLVEEDCAEKTRHTVDAQSGMYSLTSSVNLVSPHIVYVYTRWFIVTGTPTKSGISLLLCGYNLAWLSPR